MSIATTSNENKYYSLGSVAKYSCNTEFALVGQTTRVCEDTNGGTVTTGTWSGSLPTCEGTFSQFTSEPRLQHLAQDCNTDYVILFFSLVVLQRFCVQKHQLLVMEECQLLLIVIHHLMDWDL